jgi:2'-5' RNA ligase
VRPEQAHLTLVFLGEVEDSRVPALAAAIGHDVDVPPFDIAFSGIGMFPPRGAPRVVWIGVTSGAHQLQQLQRELAARSRAQGVTLDGRDFHPHLTLARWPASRPADRRRVPEDPARTIARDHVDRATLYRSRLSPTGAVYTPEARANLTGR